MDAQESELPQVSAITVPEFLGGGVRIDVSRGRDQAWWSLTDIHRLSGGDPAKSPAQWLRLEKSQEYLRELEVQDRCVESHTGDFSAVCSTVRGGPSQGTWAHHLAGLEYCRWLSPSWAVRTNREWLAYTTGQAFSPAQLAKIETSIAQLANRFENTAIQLAAKQDQTGEGLVRLSNKFVSIESKLIEIEAARGCITPRDRELVRSRVLRWLDKRIHKARGIVLAVRQRTLEFDSVPPPRKRGRRR
jgi:hypothetical protein